MGPSRRSPAPGHSSSPFAGFQRVALVASGPTSLTLFWYGATNYAAIRLGDEARFAPCWAILGAVAVAIGRDFDDAPFAAEPPAVRYMRSWFCVIVLDMQD